MKPIVKINLQKQYLYLPMITRANQPTNIFSLMKHLDKKSLLEEVGVADTEKINAKRELRKAKIEAMKQLILNHKQIPEKWIMMTDYEEILEESMKDETVLKYVIHSIDYRLKVRKPIQNKSKAKLVIRENKPKSFSSNSISKRIKKQIKSRNDGFLLTAVAEEKNTFLPKIATSLLLK